MSPASPSWRPPPPHPPPSGPSRTRRGGRGHGKGFSYTSGAYTGPGWAKPAEQDVSPAMVHNRNRAIRNTYHADTILGVRVLMVHDAKRPVYFEQARLYYNLFRQLGEVSSIDFETKQRTPSPRNGIRVTFIPPPSEPFWSRPSVPCVKILPDGRKVIVIFKPHLLSELPLAPPVLSPVRPGVSYPAIIEAPFSAITFGIPIRPLTMMTMQSIFKEDTEGPMKFKLEIGRIARLSVEFSLPDETNYRNKAVAHHQPPYICYRFEVDITRLRCLYYQKGKSIVLPLDHPPRFFERALHPSKLDKNEVEISWRASSLSMRMTDLPFSRSRRFDKSPVSLYDGSFEGLKLGEWTTYQFDLNADELEISNIETMLNVLSDYRVDVNVHETFEFVPEAEPTEFNLVDLPSTAQRGLSNQYDIAQFGQMLPFCVRYQLEVCFASNTINRYNITKDFLSQLAAMPPFQAQDLLEKAFYSKRQFYQPLDIFKDFKPRRFPLKVPRNCHLSRTITITPTTMYLQPASIEISNRVIRKFIHLSDHFVRVKFSDEKGLGKLFLDKEVGRQVYERIEKALKNGIAVGDFVYHFLAWGSSQLREHGTYCFRSAGDVTPNSIRDWMGDFANILNVAKHASRLSLAFSTTRPFSGFRVTNEEIADYEHNGYNFSDGVGKMSMFLAQMVGQALGLPDPLNDPPSVVQFRYGGHKGILAIDPKLPQYSKISTRPSQNKFKFTGDPVVEVTRVSSFAGAQLNRQLIAILSCLGIPDSIFVKKMRIAMENLSDALVDERKAIEELRKNVDHNQSSIALANLIEDGFMATREPFLMTCLYLWRAWVLKFLKDKAHIFIEQSAFVFGCVDETGKLQGHFNDKMNADHSSTQEKIDSLPQIFLQVGIPEREGVTAEYKVITGICIIARNPSLHPGDIRVVNAVDVPALHHLKNVVVLPQNGDRPISNMCSGGDLDGDDYVVIWDKDLVFDQWNVEPMSYVGSTAPVLNRLVQVNDTVDFFVHHMQKDRLPSIALAHLAQSDYQTHGARSDICLRLAQLHSDAVDFAKTGVPAVFSDRDKPPKWPHFMEKAGRSYHSHNVLGQLYDMVERVKFVPDTEFTFNPHIASLWKAVLPPPKWAEYMTKAKEMKALFDTEIKRIQHKFAVESELEVWTVFCLAHTTEKGSYKFSEELGDRMQHLKQDFRKSIYEDAGVNAVSPDYEKLGPYIAAMYEVTAEEALARLSELKSAAPDLSPLALKLQSTEVTSCLAPDLDQTGSDGDDIDGGNCSDDDDDDDEIVTSSSDSGRLGSAESSGSTDPSSVPSKSSSRNRSPVAPAHVPQKPILPSQIPTLSFPWLFPTELGTIATVASSASAITAVAMFRASGVPPKDEYDRLVYTLNNLKNRTRILTNFHRRFAQPSYSWTNSKLSDALELKAMKVSQSGDADGSAGGISGQIPSDLDPSSNSAVPTPVDETLSNRLEMASIGMPPLPELNVLPGVGITPANTRNEESSPLASPPLPAADPLPANIPLVLSAGTAPATDIDSDSKALPDITPLPDADTSIPQPSAQDPSQPMPSSSAGVWLYPGSERPIVTNVPMMTVTATGSLNNIYSRLKRR